jgi:succinoglycan biosynthesis protein ExoV
MKVFMYENVPNFGDVLNKYIWYSYFGPFLERTDDILMMGIGTVLGQSVHHTGQIIVCGSGCGYGQEIDAIDTEKWKIFFVRGPLTAKVLGLSAAACITDPGILTPEIFKAAAPTGRVVFIPHWATSLNPLWRRACIEAGMDYIDPLAPVADVAAGLSGAKLVVTEAMHGAILADAYRVPWVPAITSSHINKFKWKDWTDSLGVKPEFHDLSPLGMSDKFRDMPLGPGKADAVMQALEAGSDAKENGSSGHSRNASGPLKAVYYTVLIAATPGETTIAVETEKHALPECRAEAGSVS